MPKISIKMQRQLKIAYSIRIKETGLEHINFFKKKNFPKRSLSINFQLFVFHRTIWLDSAQFGGRAHKSFGLDFPPQRIFSCVEEQTSITKVLLV